MKPTPVPLVPPRAILHRYRLCFKNEALPPSIEKLSAGATMHLHHRYEANMTPVPEPSVDETIQILRGLRNRYERHHMLRISDGALVAAAKLGAQFIADRFLPDKAIDLIDEASARVRLSGCGLPKAAKDLDKELRELLQAKDIAIREQDFDEAGQCRDLEMEIRAQITALIQRQEGLNKNQAK